MDTKHLWTPPAFAAEKPSTPVWVGAPVRGNLPDFGFSEPPLWELVAPEVLADLEGAANPWPLFLWGGVGTGKTALAALLFLSCRGKAHFLDASKATSAIANGRVAPVPFMGKPGALEMYSTDQLRSVREAAFVVFDDIGTRRATEAQQDAFFELVKCREGRPTVYTSNLPPDGLVKVYDERVVDRIARGLIVEFIGKSLRTGV